MSSMDGELGTPSSHLTPTPISTPTSTPISTPTSTPIATPTCSSTPSSSEIPKSPNINIGDDHVIIDGGEPGSLKRRLTSVVWTHFKKKKINGVDKAVCNYCNRQLGGDSKNGTKHLHDHIKICPHRRQRDIRQSLLNPNKENKTLGMYNFDQDAAKRALAKMIIKHEYPLSIVEHEGFRDFCNIIQPLFKKMSRNTIKKEILNIYEIEKAKTINLLEDVNGKIALTTDMWTSNYQTKGYMVVSAHFIDAS